MILEIQGKIFFERFFRHRIDPIESALDKVDRRNVCFNEFHGHSRAHIHVPEIHIFCIYLGNAHERHDEHDEREDQNQCRTGNIQRTRKETFTDSPFLGRSLGWLFFDRRGSARSSIHALGTNGVGIGRAAFFNGKSFQGRAAEFAKSGGSVVFGIAFRAIYLSVQARSALRTVDFFFSHFGVAFRTVLFEALSAFYAEFCGIFIFMTAKVTAFHSFSPFYCFL